MELVEDSVRSLVSEYLAGKLAFGAFQERFVALTWDTELDDLSNNVELRLAEYTSGHWTEKELRSCLLSLLVVAIADTAVPVYGWSGTGG